MAAEAGEAQQETTVRPYLVLGVVCLGVFIAALDLTVVAPILPQIIFDIKLPITKLDQAAWIISAYLLAYTVTMPLMGRVSDIYGRRLVFVLSLGLFLAGSIVCAQAGDLRTLIAARAIQALGGGAMVPVAMAIVGDVFPRGQRAFAIGVVGAVDTAGWVLGPLYGALVLQTLSSWRWIFYINVPVSLVALVLIYLVVSRLKAPSLDRSIDYRGALVLVLGLVFLNLALGSGGAREAVATGGSPFAQESGPFAAYLVPLLVGAGVALAAFVLLERRVVNPLIDLGMFRRLTFSAANLVNLLVGGALIIAMVDVPVFVTVRETARVGEANADVAMASALALAPFTLAMMVGAVAGGVLCERLKYRLTTVIGLGMSAAGFFLMSRWPTDIPMERMAIDLVIAGLGFGLVISPLGTAVINSVQRNRMGIASALVIILRLVGMTIGLSALTSWALGRLNVMMSALPPIGQQSGESAAAYQQRLVDYSQQLVRITGQVLNEVFLISAVICLAAIVPALLLRHTSEDSRRPGHSRGSGNPEVA